MNYKKYPKIMLIFIVLSILTQISINFSNISVLGTILHFPANGQIGWGENATGGFNIVQIEPDLNNLKTNSESGNRHIQFNQNGTIFLDGWIRIKSNTTINGTGKKIIITGNGGFKIEDSKNVIICNIEFRNFTDTYDGISISNSSNIWVDHCTFIHDGHSPREADGGPDGALDITRNSTYITVSWCKFQNHKKVMLIGKDSYDCPDNITIHHCYFYRTSHRHPLVRNARVHIYNCYFYKWYDFAIGAGKDSRLVIENSIFDAKSIISTDWDGDLHTKAKRGVFFENEGPQYCDVKGSWFKNGAKFVKKNVEMAFTPNNYYDYSYSLENPDQLLLLKLEKYCGRIEDNSLVPNYIQGVIGDNISEGSISDIFLIIGIILASISIVGIVIIVIKKKLE